MSVWRTVAKWLVGLLVPFALIMLGVRVLLTPEYLQFEYHLPGFPPDEYGFTTAERLHWGTYGIKYLLNEASPAYLAELRFDDGDPVFADREVGHMRDVKAVVAGLLRAWYVCLATIGLFGLWAWKTGALETLRGGLRLGGIVTLVVGGAAAVLGTLGAGGSGALFWEFFSGFHGLFFRGDSWLFAYSDTLIRLYPLRFWQDSILYVGLLTGVAALLLTLTFRNQRA